MLKFIGQRIKRKVTDQDIMYWAEGDDLLLAVMSSDILQKDVSDAIFYCEMIGMQFTTSFTTNMRDADFLNCKLIVQPDGPPLFL